MKKFLLYFSGFVTFVLLALVSIPFLFKDQILEKTKSLASKYIAAKVDFNEDIGLSLFRDFPDISVQLNDFRIYGIEGFENDTLIYSKTLAFSADIISVIKGENIKVNKIEFLEPKLNLLVNKEGKENWDIAIQSEDEIKDSTQSNPMQINIKKLIIENGNILYNDTKNSNYFLAKGLYYEMNGDFSETVFKLKNDLEIDEMTVSSGGMDYLKKVKTSWDAVLDVDLEKDSYKFLDNKLEINELSMTLQGELKDVMKDIMQIDLKADLKETEFKDILSLIPGAYTKDYENVKTEGDVKLDFWAKGQYDGEEILPKFQLNALVKNAWVQYPDLPKKIENISLDFLLQNQTGIKANTMLSLKNLNARLGKDQVKGSLTMTELLSENPFLDLETQFGLDLAEVKNYYPLEGNNLTGQIAGDIKAKGYLAAIESESYEKIQATGFFSAKQVKIVSKEYHLPVYLKTIKLKISPEYADMSEAVGSIGSSDFSANGKLKNLVSYLFSNATLLGNLNLKANQVNFNELYPSLLEETPVTQTSQGVKTIENSNEEVLAFPDKIDFTFSCIADKVIYDKMTLDNFSSNMRLYNQKLEFKNTRFTLWNGNVLVNGFLNAQNPKTPNISYKIVMENMSISNSLKNFEWIQNYVPYTKGLVGDYSSSFNFSTDLNNDFSPNLKTLDLGGLLNIDVVDISEIKTIKDIRSKLTSNAAGEKTTLENVLLNMKMEKGNLIVKPFDFAIGEMKVNLGGKTSLDKEIDYNGEIQLPPSLLAKGETELSSLLKNSPLSSLNINTKDLLKIKLGITGDMNQPKLKLGMDDAKKQLTQNLKSTVQTALQDEKEKAKTAANEAVKKEVDKQKEKATEEIKKAVGEETNAVLDSLKLKESVGNKLKSIFGK